MPNTKLRVGLLGLLPLLLYHKLRNTTYLEGSTDNIEIRLTQKGPVFGVEYHWGTR